MPCYEPMPGLGFSRRMGVLDLEVTVPVGINCKIVVVCPQERLGLLSQQFSTYSQSCSQFTGCLPASRRLADLAVGPTAARQG